MAKDKKTSITVNDKEYFIEDFNETEMNAYNHIQDLDRKLANAQFNIDQLQVGRNGFVNILAASLEEMDAVNTAMAVNE